jgi:large subunit ribosomal protein L28
MAKCEFCEKSVSFGIKVSHSHRRTNKMWKPNVRRVKAVVDVSPKHVYACTRCLRSGKVTRAVLINLLNNKNARLMPRVFCCLIFYSLLLS